MAKNINELAKMIEKMTKEAMQKSNSSVSKVVIETGKKHVQDDVYDVYTPTMYERTGELKENWKVENTSDGIAVFNDRRDGDKYVAEVVESGIGYDYAFEYNGKPRPFTENTREELRKTDTLKNALKDDLRKSGLDVQ